MTPSCFRLLLKALLAALLVATCHQLQGVHSKPFIGVNYGGTGMSSNPISTSAAVQIMKAAGVTAVKLFSSYPEVLNALAGTGLQVMSGMTIQEMTDVAASQAAAQGWVDANVVRYANVTDIIAVAVGNEILFPGGSRNGQVVPAMRNVFAALKARNLHRRIKVVSPCGVWIIQNSYPPSAAELDSSLRPFLLDMLEFLSSTDSYLVINIYPFFTNLFFPQVDTDFIFFEGLKGYYDKGLYYQNQHDANFDAVIWAMEKAGYPKMPCVIGEAGWPTAGAPIATAAKAEVFNRRLIGKWLSNQGTPKRPGAPIKGYLFEMFDEDRKDTSIGTFELHWGAYSMRGVAKYPFSFTSGSPPPSAPPPRWCVANASAAPWATQGAVGWACSEGGVDCAFVAPGGRCFSSGSALQQATAVFNAYFQARGQVAGSCAFGGAAATSSVNPSAGTCQLAGRPAGALASLPPPPSPTKRPSPPPPRRHPPPPRRRAPPPPRKRPPPSSSGRSSPPPMRKTPPPPQRTPPPSRKRPPPPRKLPPPPRRKPPPPRKRSPPPSPKRAPPSPRKFPPPPRRKSPPPPRRSPPPPKKRSPPPPRATRKPPPPPRKLPRASPPPHKRSPPPPRKSSPPPQPPPPPPSSSKIGRWCVATSSYADNFGAIQSGLEYACGQGGVDCSSIQPGGSCYGAGTLSYLASFAFNAYFQAQGQASGSCDFGGAAIVSQNKPNLGGCGLTSPNGQWCVATSVVVQQGLDYACSQASVDCKPINQGGACYYPETLLSRASYAFNAYYQSQGQVAGSCYFGGSATVIEMDPSYARCIYPTQS